MTQKEDGITDVNLILSHLRDFLFKRLDSLGWQCSGCQYISDCDNNYGRDMKYCSSIIDAAISGKTSFEYKVVSEDTSKRHRLDIRSRSIT
jgi:hypothetical protein